ncbi:MAG: hypothetical protein ACFCVF_11590 [Kineosporiaceae bacterium]
MSESRRPPLPSQERPHGLPVAALARTSGEVLDHGWVDDGAGVLSCIAGDHHSADQLVACPYYLRGDIVRRLVRHGFELAGPPSVRRRDGGYTKITALAGPARWRELVAALTPEHGVQPLAWSLFSSVDLTASPGHVSIIDPRDAFAVALRHHPVGRAAARAHALLTGLAAAVDPAGRSGALGLTGSAALDPDQLGTGQDVDLIVYPAAGGAGLVEAELTRAGARFLPDLAAACDPRAGDYQRGRMMPPIADAATATALLPRRRDVAWVEDLRIDLTYGLDHTHHLPEPAHQPYATAPAARFTGATTITAVHPGYPVPLDLAPLPLDGREPAPGRLVITARGWQGALRPGDELQITAALHAGAPPPPGRVGRADALASSLGPGKREASWPESSRWVSIDDAAGHALALVNP